MGPERCSLWIRIATTATLQMPTLFSASDLQPIYALFLERPNEAHQAAEEAVNMVEDLVAAATDRKSGGNRVDSPRPLHYEPLPHVQFMEQPPLADILAVAALRDGALAEKVARLRRLLRGGADPSEADEVLWNRCQADWQAWLQDRQRPRPTTSCVRSL